MSGEFGSYVSGYFDEQIAVASQDCLGGDDELTRLWGKFLEAFRPVAHEIAYSEANDSNPGSAIMANMEQMPALREALDRIELYLQPFRDVAEKAVYDAMWNEKERKRKEGN